MNWLRISLLFLAALTLRADPSKEFPHPPQQEILFIDGDWLLGTLHGVVENHLIVMLPWGDTTRIPLTRIHRIFRNFDDSLVDLRRDLEKWFHRSLGRNEVENPPRVQHDEIYFTQAVNQLMLMPLPVLPERFLLEIRIRHTSNRTRSSFGILPVDDGSSIDADFTLSIHDDRIVYQQSHRPREANANWNREMPPNAGRDHHVLLYIDQSSHRLMIYVNETLIEQTNIVRALRNPLSDTSHFFIRQSNVDPKIIDRFRIRPWNGVPPIFPELGDRPLFLLRNMDFFDGDLLSVEGDILNVRRTATLSLPLPLRGINEIRFPHPRTRAPNHEGLVRSRFPGFFLHLSDQDRDETTLVGSSPNFAAPLRIPLDVLTTD